jgi:MFS family permease
VHQAVDADRKTLFLRLSVILFFAELAHGMLLYGIIPELVRVRFPLGIKLFNTIPVKAEVAGLCLAAYTLAELLFKVPAGHQVDSRGPDGVLRLGLLVSFVTVPIVLLSRDPHFMLLASFFHGVGAAPIWPAVISSWTRGRTARERGEIMGQILTGWMAGLGLGVILGNILVALPGRGRLEMVAPYAPLAMWMITIAAALWTAKSLGERAPGMEQDRFDLQDLRFPPELRIMAIGLFLQNLAFGSLILAFNFLVVEHLKLSTAQFGLMIALGGGPAVVLLGPMGRFSDRVGRRNSVIGSMLVVAPLLAAVPFLQYIPVDPWVRFGIMIPGLLLAGVAYAFLLPAWHALALGRIPEQQRGRSLALLMSVEMAALAGGHVLGPALYEKVSFMAPFLLAGGTFGVLAIIYMLGYILPRETPEEPHAVDLSGSLSPNGSMGGTAAPGPLSESRVEAPPSPPQAPPEDTPPPPKHSPRTAE